MCFDTTKYQKPKIAKEDIKCWKVLFVTGESYFQGYSYERDELQPQVEIKKHKSDEGEYQIHEGYHSYTTFQRARWNCPIYTSTKKIVEFIIPKGTRYYHNIGQEEFVSETIIMMHHDKRRTSEA